MKLVLDAGALVALERRDALMWKVLRRALERDLMVVTHGGVIGQVWRGRGAREALLAMALRSVTVVPLDDPLGRAAGELMAATNERDVVDAAIVLLADDGDQLFTSDPGDLEPLLAGTGRHVQLIRV